MACSIGAISSVFETRVANFAAADLEIGLAFVRAALGGVDDRVALGEARDDEEQREAGDHGGRVEDEADGAVHRLRLREVTTLERTMPTNTSTTAPATAPERCR